MEHGVLIDREVLESIKQHLGFINNPFAVIDEKEIAKAIIKAIDKAIESAPDAVIPISKKPKDCDTCLAYKNSFGSYIGVVNNSDKCPIITKE